MAFGIDDAINAGAAIIPAAMSAFGIGAKAADRRQINQQQKLQDMSIRGSKEMTDYSKAAELQQWKDTNWSAQRAEAEKAGLSTAYLYGKGGGTTGTVGSGGMSVGGATAANAAQTMGAQTDQAMAVAQLANINANTQKTQAEADKLKGVDTEAVTTGIEATKTGMEATRTNIEKARQEIREIENRADINIKTKADQIKQIEENAVGALLDNHIRAETKSNIRSGTQKNESEIKVNDQKIKQMAQGIIQTWESLRQGQENVDINKFREEIKANYPSIWNVGGKTVNDVADALNHLFKQTDYKKHSVENNKK